MHNHETQDTQMSRLVRIETKLSVFMIDVQKQLNKMEGKIDLLQQTFEEVYPAEEEEPCQNRSSA